MGAHLKIIKISFSIIVLLLIAGISGGSFTMKDDNSFAIKQLLQTISYLNYKLSSAYADNKNLTAAIISVFNNTDLVIENKNVAKSVPVLLYHGIINEPDGANVLLEDFKDQMFALKKAGWQTVSSEDFYAFMKGEKELPDKSFLLTFDDGRKDSYYPVDPMLKALNYRAVIFIITEQSLGDAKNNYYLSEDELKRMVKTGRWDVQAHTHSGHDKYKIAASGEEGHFYSNKLWLDDKNRLETEEEFINRVKSDFISSKSNVEQAFGMKVISFAFPFGDFGQDSMNFPEAKGVILDTIKSVYPMSFYQVWLGKDFSFNYPKENQFLIKRIEVRSYWSADNLLKVLDTAKAKSLPYFDDFNNYNGWIRVFGSLSIEDNLMILGSRSSTGGSVFLDGSYQWKDYIFKGEIELLKGQTFTLLARYKDGDNYVACGFTPEFVRIERMAGGKSELVAERKGNLVFMGKNREVGIRVQNNNIDCYADGNIVAAASDLNNISEYGGIGFETWDPQVNNSELIIKNVSVDEIK